MREMLLIGPTVFFGTEGAVGISLHLTPSPILTPGSKLEQAKGSQMKNRLHWRGQVSPTKFLPLCHLQACLSFS